MGDIQGLSSSLVTMVEELGQWKLPGIAMVRLKKHNCRTKHGSMYCHIFIPSFLTSTFASAA